MSDADEWMVIGRIAGPFGVHGEAKVELLTDFPERFAGLERIHLGPTRREWIVARSQSHQSRVLLKLQGVDTPEAVKKLTGQEIFVRRADAVELPDGHYFLDDVIGVQVFVPDGTDVGQVTEVLRTGSNDVFVVNRPPKDILIPVIQDAVRELDVENKRMVIEPWVLVSED